MSPLRRRLENSQLLIGLIGGLFAAYLWLCDKTTRWQFEGLDDLRADLAKGPVIIASWHCHIMFTQAHWPREDGQLSTLHDRSPIAQVAGSVHRYFGLAPVAMAETASNRVASRMVLSRLREGTSIAVAADGPRGPAFESRDAAVDWARVGRVPVWVYAYATRRHRRLSTWDSMILPLPFSRGAAVYSKWQVEAPRKVDAAGQEKLKADLGKHLTAVMMRAQTLAGV